MIWIGIAILAVLIALVIAFSARKPITTVDQLAAAAALFLRVKSSPASLERQLMGEASISCNGKRPGEREPSRYGETLLQGEQAAKFLVTEQSQPSRRYQFGIGSAAHVHGRLDKTSGTSHRIVRAWLGAGPFLPSARLSLREIVRWSTLMFASLSASRAPEIAPLGRDILPCLHPQARLQADEDAEDEDDDDEIREDRGPVVALDAIQEEARLRCRISSCSDENTRSPRGQRKCVAPEWPMTAAVHRNDLHQR
jgi:hypothetical protein